MLNTTSPTTATYTVKNVGTSATGMPTLSTSDTSQFSVTGCTVGMLAPNATCTATVSFTAKHHGLQSATVSASATPGGTASAMVTGTGLNPASFTLTSSTGSFDVGSVARTMPSGTIVVTATNGGDVTSPTLTASFAGNDGSFALTADTCSTKTVAAAATCSVTVQLTPKTSGPQSATLQIMNGSTVLGGHTVTGTGTPIWAQEGAGISGHLMSIHGSDAAHVFTGGSVADSTGNPMGLVLARDSASGTWSTQTLSSANQASQIWVSSATNAWVTSEDQLWFLTGSGTWNYDTKPNTPTSSSGGTVEGILTFNAGDIWSANNAGATSTIYHYTSASGWVTETTPPGAARLWGTSDTDLFSYGSYVSGGPIGGMQYPVVVHRDATGTWTRQYLGPGVATGGVTRASVQALAGVGAPAIATYAAQSSGGPLHAGSDAVWSPISGYPTGANSCSGVWAASTTAVWFACSAGVYMFDGTNFGTPFAPTGVTFTWMWGSGANDVYAVGADTNGNVAIYHLH